MAGTGLRPAGDGSGGRPRISGACWSVRAGAGV